ncbi:MAG: hypothetical protein R2712_27365 [Vicinamibacterales bacterium]
MWVAGPLPLLTSGPLAPYLAPVAGPITALWIAWFVNAFNFMDGIDGIAGAEPRGRRRRVGGPRLARARRLGGWVGVVLVGVAAGFLRHNWSPARIFMGDAGATAVGFWLAVLPVLGGSPAVSACGLLALWPFVFDATVTLVFRLPTGEVLASGHQRHYYQRLVRLGWSHAQVAVLVRAVGGGMCGIRHGRGGGRAAGRGRRGCHRRRRGAAGRCRPAETAARGRAVRANETGAVGARRRAAAGGAVSDDAPVGPVLPELGRGALLAALGVALAAAVVTAIWAASGPTIYEAEAMLVVRPPRGESQMAPASPAQAAIFTPLVSSLSTAQQVVTSLGLDGMTADTFVRDALRVNPVGGAPLIAVRVRLPDAALAARAANEVGARAVDQAQALSQQEAVDARDRMQDLRTEARHRYETAQAALEAFRRESRVDLLRKDAEGLLAERESLLKLTLELAGERARLARLDQEAAARPRIDTLTRTIDRDPAMMAAAQGASGGPPPLGLSLSDQAVNETYAAIDTDRAQARGEVAALEERLAGLKRSGLTGPQSKALDALYAAERQLADRELDVAISRKSYEQAATEFEGARLQVANRSAELAVLAPAVAPDRPLGKRVVMQALLAGALVLGAALAVLYVRALAGQAR